VIQWPNSRLRTLQAYHDIRGIHSNSDARVHGPRPCPTASKESVMIALLSIRKSPTAVGYGIMYLPSEQMQLRLRHDCSWNLEPDCDQKKSSRAGQHSREIYCQRWRMTQCPKAPLLRLSAHQSFSPGSTRLAVLSHIVPLPLRVSRLRRTYGCHDNMGSWLARTLNAYSSGAVTTCIRTRPTYKLQMHQRRTVR